MNYRDYLNTKNIIKLCEKINIPQEVIQQVTEIIRTGEANKAEPYFAGLFDPETAPDSSKAIDELFSSDDEVSPAKTFGYMTVLLTAALKLYEIYEEKGIDLDIYYDTMSLFRTVLDRDMAFYGEYSFRDTAFWYYRMFACLLYKLGTLEYEMKYADENFAKIFSLSEGDPLLSVHIPFKAVLTRELLDESYKKARSFFTKYYPQFTNAPITCGTWLLSPELKAFLPENSKILEFQSDYKIVSTDKSNDNCLFFLFGNPKKPVDHTSLPENTSLRRAAKQHLINGGVIGTGTGIYNDRE